MAYAGMYQISINMERFENALKQIALNGVTLRAHRPLTCLNSLKVYLI